MNAASGSWQRAQSLVMRLHDAVNRHNADTIAALCTPDVQWIDPAAGGLLDGREAVLRFHRDVMFRAIPDVRLRLLEGPHLSGDGSGVAVRVAITGTMTGRLDPPGFAPTGRRIEFETGEFSLLRGEHLQRHVVSWTCWISRARSAPFPALVAWPTASAKPAAHCGVENAAMLILLVLRLAAPGLQISCLAVAPPSVHDITPGPAGPSSRACRQNRGPA